MDGVSLLAKQTVRGMLLEATEIADDERRQKLTKHALASESAGRRRALLQLAQAEQPMPITPDVLDADGWLLNTLHGTIDLRTGAVRDHCRDDLISKRCPVAYDPAAEAPIWQRFLRRIFSDDREVISFIQRLSGYSLTGDVSEQTLPVFYGAGANGKSTLIETQMAMLGPDYAAKAPRDLLVARRGNHHPTELTTLHGRRLIAAVETDAGCRLAESLVKELTGGDTITARKMYQDFWQFRPTHKIWLATNHKPDVRGTDHAIWRRLLLVPFSVTIPEAERDTRLAEKLRGELPGILSWCIRGCLDWQAHGLAVPTTIRDATTSYRDDEDLLGGFVRDCCIRKNGATVRASELLRAYHAFTDDRSMTSKRLGSALTEMGVGSKRVNGRVLRTGIGLQTETRG